MTDVSFQLLNPNAAWFDPETGRPNREFFQYLQSLDKQVRDIVATQDDHETRIDALENP